MLSESDRFCYHLRRVGGVIWEIPDKMSQQIIPEIDVIIGAALWLLERKVAPMQFSIPRGKGINTNEDRQRLESTLKDAGHPVRTDLY